MGKAWEEVVAVAALAAPCELQVKNTFIDVKPQQGGDGDGGCEIDWQRQVSEPALMMYRQVSECQIVWEHAAAAQPSTRATLEAWEEVVAMAALAPCELQVKNTFIDVKPQHGGDGGCEIDWQRQVSEPALMMYRQVSDCQLVWEHAAQSSTRATLEEMSSATSQDGSPTGRDPPSVGRDHEKESLEQQGPPPPPPGEWESMHTLMMRNLPNKYTQHMLMFEINQAGFKGRYDFFYLPIDPETGANRGYAFLNFDDPAWAWLFKNVFEGRKMNNFNSAKVVSVHAAALQGFEANHGHYSTSRVNRGDPAMRPIFFREPSGDKSGATPSGRKGRRRRSGGTSAIDLAARKQQQQQEELQEKRQEAQQEEAPTQAPTQALQEECTPSEPEEAVAMTEEADSRTSWTSQPDTPKCCQHCSGMVEPRHQFCPSCGSTLAGGGSVPPPPAGISPGFGPAQAAAPPLYYVLVPHPGVGAPWMGA